MTGFFDTPFFAYDGIRIAIPGIVAYGLTRIAATMVNVNSSTARDLGSFSAGLAITVAVGFFLYFIDLPSFTPLYRNNPARTYIRDLGDSRLGDLTLGNRFFVAFDTLLPPPLRDRSAYSLDVFRIGFDIILLITGTELAVWESVPWVNSGQHSVPLGLFAIAVGIVGGAALIRVLVESQRDRAAGGNYWKRLSEQFGWLGVATVVWSGVLTAIGICSDSRWLRASAVLLPAAVWYVRYTRGVPKSKTAPATGGGASAVGTSRAHTASEVSGLLFFIATATAMGSATVSGDIWFGPRADTSVVLWVALTCAVAVLIAVKGHEARMVATNYEQREWLMLHEAFVRRELKLPRSSKRGARPARKAALRRD